MGVAISILVGLGDRGWAQEDGTVQPGPEAPPVSVSGFWSVQIGSFADRSNAQRHADRARSTGRPVSLESYNGLTRVKVGSYGSRGEARDALSALERQGFEGIVVPAE